MEKRSGNVHFSTSLSTGAEAIYLRSTMQGPYCDASTAFERKSRGSLPPSSRHSKIREHPLRSAQPSQRVPQHLEQLSLLKGEERYSGVFQQDQLDQGPLKTWGSTGKRQPARPRSKT